MSENHEFRMKIDEIFKFAGGRTVFVGYVESGVKLAPGQSCELLVENKFRQLLHIEGEMIASGSHSERRSFSTVDTVNIETQEIRKYVCIIQKA